jgi:hypothetical protein
LGQNQFQLVLDFSWTGEDEGIFKVEHSQSASLEILAAKFIGPVLGGT